MRSCNPSRILPVLHKIRGGNNWMDTDHLSDGGVGMGNCRNSGLFKIIIIYHRIVHQTAWVMWYWVFLGKQHMTRQLAVAVVGDFEWLAGHWLFIGGSIQLLASRPQMETPGPPVTHDIDSCPRSAQICRLILSRIFYHIRYCSWPKSRFWWGSLMTSSKKGRDPHSIWTSPAISSPNLAWLELDGIDLTMPIFDKKRAMVDGEIHGFSPLNKKRARHKDCNKHKLTRKYLGGSFNLLPWRCWIY